MKIQKSTAIVGILAVFAIALGVLTGCQNPTGPAHVHQWGNWIQTTAPNCTTAGVETRTCTLNPLHTETQAKAIVPNAHDWKPAPSATAPTCTEDGHGDQICAYNAAHTQSGTIPKLGHDFQNYAQTTAPTCTTTGVETGTCTRDAATTTRSIAALGHDYDNWTETTAPTCTTAGVETGTCTRDPTHKDQRQIDVDPTAHNWGEWGTPVPATATVTEDSIKTRICKNDNLHTETEIVEYATGTPGLVFDLINSNTEYRVRGGTATGAIVIPAYYRPNANSNYLPVIEIGNGTDSKSNNAFGGVSENGVLDYNRTVTSITFAEGSQLTTISNFVFFFCINLTSITIPDSVTTISGSAFYGCTGLASIIIPADVTSIGDSAFQQCSSLTSINIPVGITSIGEAVFWGCTSLTNITIPTGVTSIGNEAFRACTSLTNITIPTGVTSIGNEAFRACSSLTDITIPASVTSIEGAVFWDCTSLTSITVDGNNTNYASENGILYNKAKTTLIQVPERISISVTIPASVTAIDTAFRNCTSLTSITIPASVSILGNYVFMGWTSSQTIYIEGKADQATADAAWGLEWRNNCNAVIKYLQSDGTYQ